MHSPGRTAGAVEDDIIALRKQLERDGHEAGAYRIRMLIHDLHIRVVTTDGHLLRELQLDPTKN